MGSFVLGVAIISAAVAGYVAGVWRLARGRPRPAILAAAWAGASLVGAAYGAVRHHTALAAEVHLSPADDFRAALLYFACFGVSFAAASLVTARRAASSAAERTLPGVRDLAAGVGAFYGGFGALLLGVALVDIGQLAFR